MKTTIFFVLAFVANASAFSTSSGFAGTSMSTGVKNGQNLSMEYIPSGMSKDQWNKLKEKERNNKKNLGVVGITTFKSRSFADWQKSGGVNLFPVDPKSVKSAKDLPYMQRPGGQPDNSDLKKPNPFTSMFAKKPSKAVEPVEKPKNWWTL